MLKTPKRRESLEILAPPPYRRGHDHDSFRPCFPAFFPRSSPRLPGTRARRPATSSCCAASTAPRSASALLHRPASLGVALSTLAAGPERHRAGQARNRDPVASQGLQTLLAGAIKIAPSGSTQDEHRDR